jgi:glycosyltransferase involved in cell wall biosynthesis
MRILHFSTHDIFGGAAKATYRLHTALRDAGHSSRMVVRQKDSDDEDVRRVGTRPWLSALRRVRNRLPLVGPQKPAQKFNFDVEPEIETRQLFAEKRDDVDVLALHWITDLLTTRLIRELHEHYARPLVWTMMDQEPVTGGCHYSLGCDGYTRECGRCPQLNSEREADASRRVWLRKREHLSGLPIVFVAPTSWVAERIRESSLFGEHRVERIPLAIDTKVFRPFDRGAARDLLHVPPRKKVLFFGATYLDEPRKGMRYLVEALGRLAALVDEGGPVRREDIFLLVAGSASRELMSSLPFPGRRLGHLHDDVTLALAYQAADLFVCPSVEDAGPMMISEAMLCATPVVAFDAGSAPDLIESLRTGYRARYRDSADMAEGIRKLLTFEAFERMRDEARQAAMLAHEPSSVAGRYTKLYRSLLDN